MRANRTDSSRGDRRTSAVGFRITSRRPRSAPAPISAAPNELGRSGRAGFSSRQVRHRSSLPAVTQDATGFITSPTTSGARSYDGARWQMIKLPAEIRRHTEIRRHGGGHGLCGRRRRPPRYLRRAGQTDRPRLARRPAAAHELRLRR